MLSHNINILVNETTMNLKSKKKTKKKQKEKQKKTTKVYK